MIAWACLCGARHEQESPVTPPCWACADAMYPSARFHDARPIGEIIRPIMADIIKSMEEAE